MLRKRRGISPVVAIVILIAVAVALGIAVAFWATGLIGTLGQIEKLEVRVAYAESATSPYTGWKITIKGTNTGTSDVTVVEITLNGKPFNDLTYHAFNSTTAGTDFTSFSVSSGKSFQISLYISNNEFASGQTIEVALISGSGTTFKRTVVLP